MIKAGIIGSTGYAGGELARLLLQRDDVEIIWYGSKSYIDEKYASVYPNMFQIVEDSCMDDNMKELAEKADVIFTATPQGLCSSLIDESILSKTKVIDLSADFRIKDVAVYETWYKLHHPYPSYIKAYCKSGMLSDLFLPDRLSPCKRGAHRSQYPDH